MGVWVLLPNNLGDGVGKVFHSKKFKIYFKKLSLFRLLFLSNGGLNILKYFLTIKSEYIGFNMVNVYLCSSQIFVSCLLRDH